MREARLVGALVSLTIVLLPLAGCSGSNSSSTTAPTPSTQTYTDVFTGKVAAGDTTASGNKDGNHFTVHQAGNITATITKLSPLSTATVGLALGVYDTGAQTCNLQLFADSARLNLQLAASVSVAGEICVGVYDVGNVTDTLDFEVTILHT